MNGCSMAPTERTGASDAERGRSAAPAVFAAPTYQR